MGSRRIGYCRIARAGSYPGRIRDPFNSAPLRRYDAAGGGDDSIELNRGGWICVLWEIIFFNAAPHSRGRGNMGKFFFNVARHLRGSSNNEKVNF